MKHADVAITKSSGENSYIKSVHRFCLLPILLNMRRRSQRKVVSKFATRETQQIRVHVIQSKNTYQPSANSSNLKFREYYKRIMYFKNIFEALEITSKIDYSLNLSRDDVVAAKQLSSLESLDTDWEHLEMSPQNLH